ncbi:Calx-beta domain-containing protein [Candidatus Poriferisocius sp.]|uniref:Calx-beta domain-containing protein n=1 Tax=Candidatus Poriferisocius sp. TaxID=3101276 RepID=UPI003B52E167
MRRCLAVVVSASVLGSVLGIVPAGLVDDAAAQSRGGTYLLHRSEIVEGQTRVFEISNVGSDTYHLRLKPLSAPYTAEADDLAVNIPDGTDTGTPLAAGESGTVERDLQQRIRFEVAALVPNSDDQGDETFGVQLCTTADCTGGTILGDWTITMTDAPADTTVPGGSGVTVTIPGTSGDGVVSLMEVSRNGDNRDQISDFVLALDAAPSQDIVIVAKADTKVSTGPNQEGPIARSNAAPSSDYHSAESAQYNPAEAYYEVARFAPGDTGADLTKSVTVAAVDNDEDSAALSLTGNLEFMVLADNAAYRDSTVGNAAAYSGITIPAVPIEVTGDDEHTTITLGAATPADNAATEGDGTDTAKFEVALSRGLGAGELLRVPVAFTGATLGTHFTLALDGSPQGVVYADATDGSGRGMLTFAGPSAAEATLVVTATADDGDTVQNQLRVIIYQDDQLWRINRFDTNLVGGVCAGDGCIGGFGRDRRHSITLNEAAPGIRVIDNGGGRVTEGQNYSFSVRLNTEPSHDVTVAVTSSGTSRLSVQSAASLTFTPTNWDQPQTVTLDASTNSTDDPTEPFNVVLNPASTGDSTYNGLGDVTKEITVVDATATKITMSGDGVRANESGTEISSVMVEGDATRVDATLTISLGRALVADEYVRVPLLLFAKGHNTSTDGEECDLADLDNCDVVQTVRGPRYSANVSWPTHFNDFEMAATGTGVSLDAVNRQTPAHTGYRYLEFRGPGAQEATIELHARDGFDDGESFDEKFYILFNDFAEPNPAPVQTNLDGGVDMTNQQAWYQITDYEGSGTTGVPVPDDWPLLPAGLNPGDSFRLLYVTSQTTTAQSGDLGVYDAFVRAEITGNALVNGGVAALADHAESFKAIAETVGTTARDHAQFSPDDGDHPDVPVYWVGGAKVSDDNADFTDGEWDDEANPKHADGTAATINTSGYWTGSGKGGVGINMCDEISNGQRSTSHPRLGQADATVGLLNNSGQDGFPLGPRIGISSQCGRQHSYSHDPVGQRPMYALSDEFTVAPEGASIESASATEGQAVTFTITIPDAAPAGGITVPYTLSDGRGITSDPAYIVATGASGGTSADYDNTAGSVTVAEGQTTATFTVATTEDTTYEGDHYFTVTLGTPTGTNAPALHPRKSSAVGAIGDDADAPTLEFSSAAASVAEGDGTIDLTVTKTGTTLVPASVYWTTADDTAAHPGDYTAQSGYLEFAPGDTTKTISITITDDITTEGAETFKVQLTSNQVVAALVGTIAETTVTVTDDDSGLTVTMAGTDGDSDGNVVEGAGNNTGYRTITITLSEALTGSETVTVPLTVSGATVTTDYTFALAPATQTGVSLTTTGNTHSAQNPAVVFAPGATAATLRLTPTNNDDRTQPYVVIDYGTGARAPSTSGLTLVRPTGGPIGIVIADDETGDITLPVSAALAPADVNPGDDFRLLFRTTTARDATSSDIADYDEFVRRTAAQTGHPEIVPYAGFFKVFGSTRGGTPATGTTARVHNDMTDDHDSLWTSVSWADDSASATRGDSTVGVPTYWLGGVRIANNYTDLCDGDWSRGSSDGSLGVSTGWDIDDPRSEDGTRNVPNIQSGNHQPSEQWTGTGGFCGEGIVFVGPLGAEEVVRGGFAKTNGHPLAKEKVPNTQLRPLFGMSPVFKMSGIAVTAAASGGNSSGDVVEGAGDGTEYKTLTLMLSRALTGDETVTVPLTVVGTTVTDDFTFGLEPATQAGVRLLTAAPHSAQNPAVVFAAGATAATLRFTAVDNDDRAQPSTSIEVGTGDRAPSISFAEALRVTGLPESFFIVDDEFGSIGVPYSWPLKPSAIDAGEEFRLLFVTSENRDAVPTDIDVYNRWAQVLVGKSGHEALGRYSTLVKVLGSTAAVDARVNVGTWDPAANSNAGGYADGSTSAGGEGIPIYWLAAPPADKVADNYFDFYDGDWDSTADTFESGADRADSVSVVSGSSANGRAFPSHALGQSTVQQGFGQVSDVAPNSEKHPMFVMSPLFKVEAVAFTAAVSGDMVEGAGDGTEHTTLTLDLGRTLTGDETVTVPLTVQGAAVTDDYTVGLHGTNTGVTLLIADPHSAQNPAVRFAAGAGVATLRFTAVDNDDRTQPYVAIEVGSGARAPSTSFAGTPQIVGLPDGFVIVDDETGDITLPASGALAPADLDTGDDFRLLFRTTTVRDATSSDIGDYDEFVRRTAAQTGHPEIVPYAGFFKVFGSTRGGTPATGTTARVHNDMTDDHDSAWIDVSWADGSTKETRADSTAGVPTYWLGGVRIANNYADLCDGSWSAGRSDGSQGVITGWDIDKPRSEDGTRNVPNIVSGDYQPSSQWTGTTSQCQLLSLTVGGQTVSAVLGAEHVGWGGFAKRNGGPLYKGNKGVAPNTQLRPLFGMSPVFKVMGATTVTAAVSGGNGDGDVVEGAGDGTEYKTLTLTLDRALTGDETVTVPLTVAGATVTTDYTFGLHGNTNTGVMLLTAAPHSAQNPAVRFAAGAAVATLRFTPVDNSERSQPSVSIGVGTGARAPSLNFAETLEVAGLPVTFAVVDDETGDLVVPLDWPLRPAAVGGGEQFRLLFVTSEVRDAVPTDIDVYNRWAQGVVARNGHADLLPYGGLVKVVGSTATVDARINLGTWDPSANSNAGGHADGSAAADDPGIPIYWLAAPPANKLADNYFDFFDLTWDSYADTFEDGADRNAPDVSSWTGTFYFGSGYNNHELGQPTVAHSLGGDRIRANSVEAPMLVFSPTFTVEQFAVTAEASGGNGDGDVVEGAGDGTEHKTLTLTLERVLTGNETVMVPLEVRNATVTTDYTFGLHGNTNTGVTLLTAAPHSAQNPAVRFAAGATVATLRFTAGDNDVRSQPHVVIDIGTGARAPSSSFAGTPNVAGLPAGFAILDNERGDIVVPYDWPLRPTGVGGGEQFRLMFATSEYRDAAPTDIEVYNRWAQGVAGRGGHESLLPYSGLVKVFGSTATVDARINLGTWDPSANSNAGGHADGSAAADDAGISIHWLAAPPADKVADNYFDFHDGIWSNGDVITIESGAEPVQAIPGWTGSGINGLGTPNLELGRSGVQIGLSPGAYRANDGERPMLVLSPVFTASEFAVTATVADGNSGGDVVEGNTTTAAGYKTVKLTLDRVLSGSETVTVPLTVQGATVTEDFTFGLHGNSNTAVTLLTAAPHSAQNPAVRFAAGNTTATLRFTPVDNDRSAQPFVTIGTGTGDRGPSSSFVGAPRVEGLPVTFAIVDDDMGAIEVPADWALTPSGLASGDEFRLVFITSGTRKGKIGNLAYYQDFLRQLAASGHESYKPYARFSLLLGCFAGRSLRDHTGIGPDGTEVSFHWLNGPKVADTHDEFLSVGWEAKAVADVRSEKGVNVTVGRNRTIWTGCNPDGTIAANPLGTATPNFGGVGYADANPLGSPSVANGDNHRQIMGVSPLFRVEGVAVTAAAADGDGNGDVTEGDTTTAAGYKTLTLTLNRPLTGYETVTVPLTVAGATVTTDYTFGLHGNTNTAVTLLTTAPHSAQNPAVRFAAGSTTATLRFTPVDNSERSQPSVSIEVGTGARAPSVNFAGTVGVAGLPVTFAVIDDETGDLVVPLDWPLNPSGAGAGDQFRLLFVTSESRMARSTDIAVYNRWAQGVAGRKGHESLLPYSGLLKAVASTPSTGARTNVGTWDPSANSNAGGQADGSAAADDPGVPIYWLNGDKLADNYFDFYDRSWDSTADTLESGELRTDDAGLWSGSSHEGRPIVTYALGGSNALRTSVSFESLQHNTASGAVVSPTHSPFPFLVMSPTFTVDEVTVTVAPSGGNGDGDVVEGAGDGTEYKTITLTLDRALTGAQTVTVPLTVSGSTVAKDHRFGLSGTNTGVMLLRDAPNSAQNPAVLFVAGATTATIRITAVDNNESTQPYVVVGVGDGAREPSTNFAGKPRVVGLPEEFVILDNETGDVVVPQDWPLKPAGAGAGDQFRLLFVTSVGRDATSTDIEVYNRWAQGVASRKGHASLGRYSGLVKVLASTATTDARINVGTWDPSANSGSGGHADGSAADDDPGVPIYWLNGDKLADNYFDFYDGSWDSLDDTLESGEARTGDGLIWSGSWQEGVGSSSGASMWQLGGTCVQVGRTSGATLAIGTCVESGVDPPFFVMSPTFTVDAVTVTAAATGGNADGDVVEGASDGTEYKTITLTLDRALTGAQTVTVPLRVRNATVTDDFTFGLHGNTNTGVTLLRGAPHSAQNPAVQFKAGATTATIRITAVNNSERSQPYVVIGVGTGARAPSSSFAGTPRVDNLPVGFFILDDESASEIVVPADWPLKPSDVFAGDRFRLLFITSEVHNAQATDIAVYNRWAQEVAGADGHASLGRYSGLVKVVASTATTDARDNVGTWDPSAKGGSGGHADGSTSAGSGGVPIYWLNSGRAADNYFDFYDGSWDSLADTFEDGTDRSGDNPLWTGTWNWGIGASNSSNPFQLGAGCAQVSNTSKGALSANVCFGNNAELSFFAMSPVFQVQPVELDVVLSASGGNSDGNPVEGAAGSTGYVTVSVSADRALEGAESVTVPLSVSGATMGDDFTFALEPAKQSGVALLTAAPHSAQNPAVVLSAGAQSATWRLTPVDNSRRTQPFVAVDFGTGARAPSAVGVDITTSGDVGVVLVDDETGDIRVGPDWPLAPSGLSGGDDFRLLFRTSELRDATSGDIADYDRFIRAVAARGGHEALLPYAGFFKVFGSTLDTAADNSTGTSARVHNGLTTIHRGQLPTGPWADGSQYSTVGNTAGVPTYWLGGAKLANNYADLCDLKWSTGDGVTTGWHTNDPRSEDGERNIPTGAISNFRPYEPWTGTGNACAAYDHPLGANNVSRGSADRGGGQSLLHQGTSPNTQLRPLYGYSPVFKIADVSVTSTVAGGTSVDNAAHNALIGDVYEGAAIFPNFRYKDVTLTLDRVLAVGETVTVPLTVRGSRVTENHTFGLQGANTGVTLLTGAPHSAQNPAVRFAAGATVATLRFRPVNDSVPSGAYVIIGVGEGDRSPSGSPFGSVPVSGSLPVEFRVIDNEDTGDIVVPYEWPLRPDGVEGGDEFRLFFITYETRNATDTNIGVYDKWAQSVAARRGPESLGPYGGLLRVVASTADVQARDHIGTYASGGHADGSRSASDSGVSIHWIGGEKVADNYHDFHDGTWDSVDDRHEDGSERPAESEVWSGSGSNGLRARVDQTDLPLGVERPAIAQMSLGRIGSNTPVHRIGYSSDNRSLMVMSPVFKVAARADIDLALSISGGDANGHAVEGAAGPTGYRTVTVALSRPPLARESEAVTVPLTVAGATVGEDYTFELAPATQTAVLLLTSAPHSPQNPALVFGTGATEATLRLRPIDNGRRTQPYVSVGFGTGSRAPSAVSATVGTLSGPVGTVLLDDETGDIEVPADWSLTPSGLSLGDDFRLLFRTSTTRDATSTDIADYDEFVRTAAATNGHPDVLDYVGFFKAFASTLHRDADNSTGTTARVHNGLSTIHRGHLTGGPWADGSTRATVGSTAGVPTYWLNGALLANNYADLCDLKWAGGNGITGGFDTDDPRSEDGSRNIPAGTINNYRPYEPWTGTGNACESFNYPMGADNVSRGAADSGAASLHVNQRPKAQLRPLYGYSPVFKVVASPVDMTLSASDGDDDGNAVEGAADFTGYRTITLTPSRPLVGAEVVTVPLSVRSATVGDDYTLTMVPSLQTGVTFRTSAPHSAQRPAVILGAGATRATLRLRPVDNNSRTQPYALVDYGSGARSPTASNVVLGSVSGGPIGVMFLDDETGAVGVPADWALLPAGLGVGDKFRLLAMTSQSRDAVPADIGDYDLFVRRTIGANGHADLAAYGGLFKVFGGTRAPGSNAGVAARAHNGLWDGSNWVDGSTSAGDAGTPTYWVGGAKVADNYFDFCDGTWDNRWTSISDNHIRHEDGSAGDGAEVWTGAGAGCDPIASHLGSSTPTHGPGTKGSDSSSPMGTATDARTNQKRFYAMSPEFTVVDASVTVTLSATGGNAAGNPVEGAPDATGYKAIQVVVESHAVGFRDGDGAAHSAGLAGRCGSFVHAGVGFAAGCGAANERFAQRAEPGGGVHRGCFGGVVAVRAARQRPAQPAGGDRGFRHRRHQLGVRPGVGGRAGAVRAARRRVGSCGGAVHVGVHARGLGGG